MPPSADVAHGSRDAPIRLFGSTISTGSSALQTIVKTEKDAFQQFTITLADVQVCVDAST